MKKTVMIPEPNVEKFEARMNKLEKLSKKLDCGKVECTLIGTEIKESRISDRELVKMKYFIYEVEGDTPTLNGYSLVAIMERQINLNLVTHVNKDIELPKGLSDRKNYCEHCNSNRARKYLFLLQEESTGKFIQVGKSCVKDFTGSHKNAESIANYYSYFEQLEELEEFEDDFKVNRIYTYLDVRDAIALSVYFTKLCGYVKVWDNTEKNPSTRNRVSSALSFGLKDDFRNTLEAEGCFKDADRVIDWAMSQDNPNDYIGNIQTQIRENLVKEDKLGFIVSAYFSYVKSMEKAEQEKEREQLENNELKESEYIGEIGKRSEYELTFKREVHFDTAFGLMSIYFFHDSDDNLFIWKTNKSLNLEKGERISMTATLKDHTEYNGVKQNVLTRCSKIKVFS